MVNPVKKTVELPNQDCEINDFDVVTEENFCVRALLSLEHGF